MYYVIDKNRTNDSVSLHRLKAAYLQGDPIHVDFSMAKSKDAIFTITTSHSIINSHDDASVLSDKKTQNNAFRKKSKVVTAPRGLLHVRHYIAFSSSWCILYYYVQRKREQTIFNMLIYLFGKYKTIFRG